jgi:hypothetical protein
MTAFVTAFVPVCNTFSEFCISDRIRQDQTGSERIREDQTGSEDQIGSGRIRQDQTGSDRIRQDQTGSDSVRRSLRREILVRVLEAKVLE